MKEINDEAIRTGEEPKETIKKLAKAVDKGREVSVQEGVYRALGLPLTKFSCKVKFINSAHPERREGLLKSKDVLANLPENESIFHNSIHNYYEARPYNANNQDDDDTDWDGMCLADFVANYDVNYSSGRKNAIPLQKKKGSIVKRGKEAVIRYFLRQENEEEYYRALLVLFLPFRNEMNEIHSQPVEALYLENIDLIEGKRDYYERNRNMVNLIQKAEEKSEAKADDSDEEEDEYLDEETTDLPDIKEFIKDAEAEARRMLTNMNGSNVKMVDTEYYSKLASLNAQQQRIFYDFAERMLYRHEDSEPFYLYVAGEAGTGKSFLLCLMIEFSNRLQKRSGQALAEHKPVSITVAPTGVAAFLVNGSTIESALGINPQQRRNFVPSSYSRNSSLRYKYEELSTMFCDEISMVGTDKFVSMHIQMQGIRGNNLFMGGVSMVVFGDFGQLPPVGQSMIWERSHLDSRPDIAPNHWNENFTIYHLTQKMRSQDNQFSEMCDKIRLGQCDGKVKRYLESKVRKCPDEDDNESYASGKLCIIVAGNTERREINKAMLEKLLPHKKNFKILSSDQSTNVRNPPPLSKKLALAQTGQLEGNLDIREGAPVMVTSNHPQKKYKENGMVNGARGYIDSIQTSKDDQDVVEVIWVKFKDPNIGKLMRNDNKDLLRLHKPNDSLAVPIKRQTNRFNVQGGANWTRQQFPLTLSYSITSHKVNILLSNSFYHLFLVLEPGSDIGQGYHRLHIRYKN